MHCFFPLGIHCPLCCMLSKQSAPSKSTHLVPNGDTDSTPRLSRGVLSALDRVGGLHGRPVMSQTMRHRWLLLGACGWVLLILMFASKFISFRTTDGKLGETIYCITAGLNRSNTFRSNCCIPVDCLLRLWGEVDCTEWDTASARTGKQGGRGDPSAWSRSACCECNNQSGNYTLIYNFFDTHRT
jgi:hypothetical protein